MLILECRDHHRDDHADDAEEGDHGEALRVVEAPHLRAHQADGRDHPDVVVDAVAQRTDFDDRVQGQGAEAKSAWHEEAEVPELNHVAPHLGWPANDLQAEISECLAVWVQDLHLQQPGGRILGGGGGACISLGLCNLCIGIGGMLQNLESDSLLNPGGMLAPATEADVRIKQRAIPPT